MGLTTPGGTININISSCVSTIKAIYRTIVRFGLSPLMLQEWLLSVSRIRDWSCIAQDIQLFFPHVSWRLKFNFRKEFSPSGVLICFEFARAQNVFHLETNVVSSPATKHLNTHSVMSNMSGTLYILQGFSRWRVETQIWKQKYLNVVPGNLSFSPIIQHTFLLIWVAISSTSLPTSPVRRMFFGHLDATSTSVVQPGQLKVSAGKYHRP